MKFFFEKIDFESRVIALFDDNSFLCRILICRQKPRPSIIGTGKSFSEAIILASVNPQYHGRLFIELQEHAVYPSM